MTVDSGDRGSRADAHSLHVPAEPANRRPGYTQSSTDSDMSKTVAAYASASKASPNAVDSLCQHVQMQDVKLSFWQKHFTQPVDQDPEKESSSQNRRFAFFSRGAMTSGGVMLLVLLGLVAAAVAVNRERHHRHSSSPGQHSPIRAAIDDNFADPAVWLHEDTYYAFATNNAAGILQRPNTSSSYDYGVSNVQIATSKDFINWTLLNSTYDPLPRTGDWVAQGLTRNPPQIPRANVWAPDLFQRKSDNRFVMYYAANKENATAPGGPHPNPHCIGAAVSEGGSPAGPYKPVNKTIACPIDQGGAIDPSPVVDRDGTVYVVYKVDGNNIGHGGVCGNTKAPIVSTPLMLQKMQLDGVNVDGEPIQIMDRKAQDGPLVEAPAIVRTKEGIYFLFFSSGCTREPSYDIKVATSTNITGPYVRAERPLLQTGDFGLLAPGSASVHNDGADGFNMVFHARVQAPQGRIRAMFSTKLDFKGHTVKVVADTQKPA